MGKIQARLDFLILHPKGKINVSKVLGPLGGTQRFRYDVDFDFDSTRPYIEDNEFENIRNTDSDTKGTK